MTPSRRVLITGGASGLGRALARRYARAGWRVALADIDDAAGAEALAELRATAADVLYCRVDVTREDDLRAAADAVTAAWDGLDVLVNNAGVANAGAIEDVSLEDWQWVIDIDLLGVVRGCKVFTPMFKAQGAGQIVNIASLAGLLDIPFNATYNVAKAGVVALSGTLDSELRDFGIGVSVVCPSFFQTNLAASFRTTDPRLKATLDKVLARGRLSADDVAEAIFRGVERRTFMILPHPEARLIWGIKRFAPHWLYRKMLLRNAPTRSRARRQAT